MISAKNRLKFYWEMLQEDCLRGKKLRTSSQADVTRKTSSMMMITSLCCKSALLSSMWDLHTNDITDPTKIADTLLNYHGSRNNYLYPQIME